MTLTRYELQKAFEAKAVIEKRILDPEYWNSGWTIIKVPEITQVTIDWLKWYYSTSLEVNIRFVVNRYFGCKDSIILKFPGI